MGTDFNGGKPVKTVRNNDLVTRLVGKGAGDSTGEFAAVVAEGTAFAASTNDSGIPSIIKDKDGEAMIPTAGDGGGLKVELIDAEGDELLISDDGEALVRIEKAQGANSSTVPGESVLVGGSDGTNIVPIKVDSSGAVVTVSSSDAAADVLDYQTTATVGVGNPTNHDYLITTAKTFKGRKVLVGARGAVKVRVGTYNGTTFTPKFCYFQDPKENTDHDISRLTDIGDGTEKIRVEITNLDSAGSDVYSTLQGDEY
jgi:hypothetical protein